MNQQTDFGNQIKEQRGWIGLTQAELARRVACATITIRKIEANDLRPSAQIAERIAMALDVPLEERSDFIRAARSISPDTPQTPASPTPSSDEIGAEDLSGRAIRGYELADRIGAGGFGVVYRATQPLVEREVAVKIILPKLANDPKFIRRFEAEAQIVARLEHPYIVPLYDYWREPNAAYLVFRLLRGGNLRQRISDGNGGLPVDFILRVLEHIGAALYTAHRAGVIHRDLKPANILLDEDDNAYLADFGIAKNLVNPDMKDLTQTGAITGSMAYASPEQLKTEPVKPQADIYALGILLYEMLCGHHPYHCDTPLEYYVKHTSEPLPSLAESNPDLAASLDPVLEKATAKDPLERFSDVPGFVAAFQEALISSPSATTQITETIDIPPEFIENPYKGLRPFGEADQDDFFGQEMLIQTLLGRMSEDDNDLARFLAVVGPSGSGKSSVVQAGVLPALRRGIVPGSENWFIVEMQPGTHPLEELEAVLLRVAVNPPESMLGQLQESKRGLLRAVRRILPEDPAVELVLIIDQFEEIFTLVQDEDLRSHFLESLVTAVVDPRSRLRVAVTFRADFLDQPLRYVDFGELIRQQTEMVLPLTPDELEMAITAPARKAGLIFEPGLVSRIIREIGDQPGGLPLLQYTLTELFERREGNQLTNAAYQDFGGVLGALGHRAEQIYSQLDSTGKEAARQLFLRLVTLGEGTEDTRRRVERSEIFGLQNVDQAQMEAAIDLFGRHRLLTFDRHPATRGPTVEVAHEAVLCEWRRLRRWLDESRVDLHMQRVLTNFAAEWTESDRDPGMLLRGTRLSQFKEWVELTTVNLTAQEDEYLQTSLSARHQRELEETERQEKEAALENRSRRFLQALVGVFAVAMLIAIVLSIFALDAQRTAQAEAEQRATAQAMAEAESEARALAEAQALADRDRALEAYSLSLTGHAQNALEAKDTASALVLAMAASDIENPPEEVQRVLRNVAYEPEPRERLKVADIFPGVEGRIYSLGASPAENRILVGFEDGSLILWDLDTHAEVHRLHGHTNKVYDVAFSPDGRKAITGGGDRQVILWDLETGTEIHRLKGHKGWVRAVAISPDGRTAVSGGFAGDSIVSNAEPGELILWDLESGEIILRFGEGSGGQPYGVVDAAFTPDGQSVLASYGIWTDVPVDFTQILWDIESGEPVYESVGLIHDNYSIAITPDESQAISGGSDNNVHIWDLSTGEEIQTLTGHDSLVSSIDISPDGRRAFTGDWNGGLVLWDLGSNIQLMNVNIHNISVPWNTDDFPPVNTVFLSDGRTGLSSAGDGTLVIWELINAGQILRFDGHTTEVTAVAFTPDGKYILTGAGRFTISGGPGDDNTMKMWEVETGRLVRIFEGHTDSIMVIAVSPDGRRALTGGGLDGTIKYWDLSSGELIRSMDAHPTGVFALAFSPEGQQALSGPMGKEEAILWDLATGEIIYRIPYTNENSTDLIFHPDGHSAYSGYDELTLLDVENGGISHQYQTGNCCTGFAIHPDWKSIFTVSGGDRITQWDLERDTLIREFGDHDGSRSRLEISPDGNILLSSDSTGNLYLWDPNTGNEIRRFHTDTSVYLFDIDISPDGRLAITPAEGGSAILWDLTLPTQLGDVMDWISANRYVRELTCEERARYSIEPLCETEVQ